MRLAIQEQQGIQEQLVTLALMALLVQVALVEQQVQLVIQAIQDL